MFIELAFIDWIALAFAAILLAGAAAAAVLAFATSRARTSEPKNGYAHAATAVTAMPASAAATSTPGVHATNPDNVVDLRDHRPIHSAAEGPQHVASSAADTDSVEVESVEVESVEVESVETSEVADEVLASSSTEAFDLENRSKGAVEVDEVLFDESCDSAEIIELPARMPEPSVTSIDPDTDSAVELASRAARLRGRPISEPATAESAALTIAPPAEAAGTAPKAETVANRIGFSERIPGFFEDPMGRHELRYWDGSRWTEYVKESGERFTDPL